MGNDILQHLAQCLAHSQAQLMAPLISITYLGHLSPPVPHKRLRADRKEIRREVQHWKGN